jgi:23S rRNA (uracil1939-C5)-methyltransferase
LSKPSRGETIELPVTGMAFGGQGIMRSDDFVIFVAGGVPGDTVRATVTKVKKRYAEARLEEVTVPSSDRVDPSCSHFGGCGGCRWQSLDYEVQLRYKQQQVVDSLERLGGLSGFEVGAIRGMDDPWRYRNKVEFSIGRADGELVVGFHPPGRWDAVLPQTECRLLPEATEAARTTVEEWLRRVGAAPWDPRTHEGYARHLSVREAFGTGEVLVSLVTAPGTLPEPESLVAILRERHPQIVGVLHAVNEGEAEVATGVPYVVLWGRPHLFETLGDLRFKISIDAFFQTNSRMAPVLYSVAADEAALSGDQVVWDIYSGIGSIALSLAGRSRSVLGIEIVPVAVRDAVQNAADNGIGNTSFLEGNARVVLKEVLEGRRSLPADVQKPDVVVVDPPRGGLAHKVIQRIAAAAPERVVYVSCNPTTLAPDAALFAESGYRLTRVTPVDMFPHTPHVEAVALLKREA